MEYSHEQNFLNEKHKNIIRINEDPGKLLDSMLEEIKDRDDEKKENADKMPNSVLAVVD